MFSLWPFNRWNWEYKTEHQPLWKTTAEVELDCYKCKKCKKEFFTNKKEKPKRCPFCK